MRCEDIKKFTWQSTLGTLKNLNVFVMFLGDNTRIRDHI